MSATLFDGAWELTPADRPLVQAKRWGNRLRFAIMLLFYRARGRFPRAVAEVDKDAVAELARTLGVPTPDDAAALLPSSDDRTLERQRAEIRALLGFREATVADAEDLGAWLRDHAAARTRDLARLSRSDPSPEGLDRRRAIQRGRGRSQVPRAANRTARRRPPRARPSRGGARPRRTALRRGPRPPLARGARPARRLGAAPRPR